MSYLSRQWKGKTGGGSFGQSFLFFLLKRLNVIYIYPLIYCIAPFYILFSYKNAKSIYKTYRIHFKFPKLKSFKLLLSNHIIFGKIVIDKFASISSRTQQFQFEIENEADFKKLLNNEKGFIIASSHVGNFELIGHCLKQDKKNINGIVFGEEVKKYQTKRIEALKKSKINLIPIKNDLSHLFKIKEVLEQGEIVTIPSDRIFGSSKSIALNFIDAKANFPVGSFKIAAQLDLPIIAIYIMKESKLKYKALVFNISKIDNKLPTFEKINILAKNYVESLELIVKKYPNQWFNFYDFWQQ